jgi:drug/metabolite transporter (DMT)-like permease
LLIGFALIPTLLAYLLFNYGLKSVESHRAGVLNLSEPLARFSRALSFLGKTCD